MSEYTLHCGDCLEVMRDMRAESVDMVFTSPPYNLLNSTGNGLGSGKGSKWTNAALRDGYESHGDSMLYADYVRWQKKVLTECWRLIRPNGAIYYNHKPRVQNGELRTPLDLNPALTVRQIVIWARAGGINFNQTFYMPAHEWIVIFAKPDFRLRDQSASGASDVWYIPQESDNPHPAPFPVELPRRAIETTNAQVVLDPFMGSGSTGVACMELDRRFIGVEISQQYIDKIAEPRIADAARVARKEFRPMPGGVKLDELPLFAGAQ